MKNGIVINWLFAARILGECAAAWVMSQFDASTSFPCAPSKFSQPPFRDAADVNRSDLWQVRRWKFMRESGAPICLSIKSKDRTYKLTITLPWDLCAPQTVFQAEKLAAMVCVRVCVCVFWCAKGWNMLNRMNFSINFTTNGANTCGLEIGRVFFHTSKHTHTHIHTRVCYGSISSLVEKRKIHRLTTTTQKANETTYIRNMTHASWGKKQCSDNCQKANSLVV